MESYVIPHRYSRYTYGRRNRRVLSDEEFYLVLKEAYQLQRARLQRQMIKEAMYPIRQVVDEKARIWMDTAIRKRRRFGSSFPSLVSTLEGQRILPIVTTQDSKGKDVRVVEQSGIHEEFACTLVYQLLGYSFTVKVIDNWLVVDKVTMKF